MKTDFITTTDFSMRTKMRTLFRAFFINLILGAVALVLTYIPVILYIAVLMTGISPMVVYFSVISAIALWQMLNVIFFLVPAIAIWWERKTMA